MEGILRVDVVSGFGLRRLWFLDYFIIIILFFIDWMSKSSGHFTCDYFIKNEMHVLSSSVQGILIVHSKYEPETYERNSNIQDSIGIHYEIV